MPYLIGIDEAGYGPNLGPLVISATVWQVDGDLADGDLYKRLRGCVAKSPAAKGGRLAIADSKVLYSPAQGIGLLERGVLAAVRLTGGDCSTWRKIWAALDGEPDSYLDPLPWHAAYDHDLPLVADPHDLAALDTRLREKFARAGVRLVALRSTAVFPERFNEWTGRCGTKGEALSQLTLRLAGEALGLCEDEPVMIVCDKHGGRNQYGRLLQQQFPDPLIEVYAEQLAESIYRWGPPERRMAFHFRARGESFLPVALASMTSKYLRELAMRAFNHFWCSRVENLEPTAGYPLDARRFRAAIRETQTALGIDDRVLWRSR